MIKDRTKLSDLIILPFLALNDLLGADMVNFLDPNYVTKDDGEDDEGDKGQINKDTVVGIFEFFNFFKIRNVGLKIILKWYQFYKILIIIS